MLTIPSSLRMQFEIEFTQKSYLYIYVPNTLNELQSLLATFVTLVIPEK
jgi:hypothetical protein